MGRIGTKGCENQSLRKDSREGHKTPARSESAKPNRRWGVTSIQKAGCVQDAGGENPPRGKGAI